ncbi:MAG: hypothetical protein J1G02_06380 [Clostridiales bacterium]|nr:hypothetical protein [Clostridiales bacterium]
MEEFTKFKNKVIDLLKQKGLDEITIEEILKDEDIYLAINNHISEESVVWAILF